MLKTGFLAFLVCVIIYLLSISYSTLFVFDLSIDAKRERPNIIFILADDLGWSDVSWNNENVQATPFLEEMAKNGTILTQSYSTHRCTASRAALLTGRYPWRYGLGTHPIPKDYPVGLPPSETILPEKLREAYRIEV